MGERKINIEEQEIQRSGDIGFVNKFIDGIAAFHDEEIPEVIKASARNDDTFFEFMIAYDWSAEEDIERFVIWQVNGSEFRIDETIVFADAIILQRDKGNNESLSIKLATPHSYRIEEGNIRISNYGLSEFGEIADAMQDDELFKKREIDPSKFVKAYLPLFNAYLYAWVSHDSEEFDDEY